MVASFENLKMLANSIKDTSRITKIVIVINFCLVFALLWLGIYTLWPAQIDESTTDTSSIIVRQVRDVSELTTAIFEMDTVVPVKDKTIITESKLLYIAHGNVRVGIDLGEFSKDNIKIDGDKIAVYLPPLKVLDSKLDLYHSSVYSYDKGFLGLGPEVVNLQSDAQRQALKKVEEAACQDWLIKAASDRVEKTVDHLLSQILKDRGYREIIVKTQTSETASCSKKI